MMRTVHRDGCKAQGARRKAQGARRKAQGASRSYGEDLQRRRPPEVRMRGA